MTRPQQKMSSEAREEATSSPSVAGAFAQVGGAGIVFTKSSVILRSDEGRRQIAALKGVKVEADDGEGSSR